MKKPMMFAFAALLCAATATFAQNTPKGSNNPSAGGTRQEGATPSPSQPQNTGGNIDSDTRDNPGGQQAQKTTINDATTRPGGESHKNANDVGRYSESEDSKSMTHSKEALEARRKNMTEPDTTMKKGSGASEKNMKNHTGKTGNYQNRDSKQSHKPRE